MKVIYLGPVNARLLWHENAKCSSFHCKAGLYYYLIQLTHTGSGFDTCHTHNVNLFQDRQCLTFACSLHVRIVQEERRPMAGLSSLLIRELSFFTHMGGSVWIISTFWIKSACIVSLMFNHQKYHFLLELLSRVNLCCMGEDYWRYMKV